MPEYQVEVNSTESGAVPSPVLTLKMGEELDLNTDANSPYIKQRESVLRSSVFLFGSNVLRLGISFALIPVMTRFLDPHDYGLFNLAYPIIIAFMCAADLGFAPVLVRSQVVTQSQETSVLLISVLGGLAISTVIYLGSDTIALSLGQPGLASLLRECTIVLMLGALCSAPFARLQREGQMRGFAIGDIVGAILGGGAAVLAAWNGAGVQSLVIQQVISMGARLVAAVIVGRFSANASFDTRFVLDNVRFATYTLGSSVMSVLAKSIDSVVIGIVFGPVYLGLYSLAMQIIRLPEAIVVGPIYTALLPAFSRTAHEHGEFMELYESAMFLVITLCVSLLGGISLISLEIVGLMLGKNWSESGQIMQVLGICALGNCISSVQQAALLGSGYARVQFIIMTSGTLFVVIGVLLGSYFGIMGSVFGISFSVFATSLMMIVAVCRLRGIAILRVLRAATIPLVSAVGMAASVQIVKANAVFDNPISLLAALIATGAVIFSTVFLSLGGYPRLRLALKAVMARG